MAAYENSDELTATCEGEIADLLQADLNLRATDWTISSTEETNEVQEEICESVVEEIVVDQGNEDYLACSIDDNCMEESIVYVFEEPIVEFELSDSHYIIQEPEAYDLEEAEAAEVDTMESESSQDADKNEAASAEEMINSEENVVQGTSKVEVSEESVNKCSENELVVNKCTLDLPISSDNSLKTCNFNENSDSVDNLLINNALISENIKVSDLEPGMKTPSQVNSLYGDDDSNIVIEPLPENIPFPVTPEIHPKPEIEETISKMVTPPIAVAPTTPTTVITPPNMLPSVLNRNKLTPLIKTALPSELSSPLETKSPQSDNSSSPALRTLGKEQIKKRLQSFSLLKQGITAIPIKKIISPKQPKVQLQMGEVYDEAGRKTDEKMIIKKPPKQGPTPSEKARQVIDEIEQIKREEAAIYEQTLSFMKHSMRDAHKKKSKSRIRDRDRSKSPIRRDKRFDHSKRSRKISEEKFRRSLENDKHHRSFENDKFKKKKRDKSVEKEKPKEEEMPQSWTEVKLRKMDFEKINKIKDRIFKFTDDKNFKRGEPKNPEVEESLKREDYLKPQLIFEFPSLLRTPIFATTEGLKRKYFPSALIRFTEKLPSISFCENPIKSVNLFRNRKQILSEVSEERAEIMLKIIENKNGSTNACRYVEERWYPSEYLTESKNEVEAVTSYGLSVLSEMYNDEHEENHEAETEKTSKKKEKKSKSKKKHKKRKSKSKSRSSSKEKDRKHDDDKEDEGDKKSKQSKKHEELDENNEKNSSETKSEEEVPANKDQFKEENQEKEPNEDNTPNTDEYRSNWESDEDILNEIIRTNDRVSYNKPYQGCLDKNWEIEEEIPDKYDPRRKFDEKERKKVLKSSSERISEEQNRRRSEDDKRKLERNESRRSEEIRPEIEDRRSSVNIFVSPERLSRHENRRESEDFEYRRSSVNLRRTEENVFSRHNYEKSEPKQRIDSEEISGYEVRQSSRHSFEKSETKKSADYKYEHEDKADFESRRPSSNLRRSEDNERIRQQESDYKKSRESIERNNYERQRKLSDSEHHRKTNDSSKLEDERRSRYSVEHDRRKLNDFKDERLRYDSDNRKSQEFVHKKSRFDSEEIFVHKKPVEEKIRLSSDRDHRKLKENRRESLEKSRDRQYEPEESSKQDTNENNRHLPKYKPEERDHHSIKETKNFDHKRRTEIEENKIARVKKLSCSSDDRKRDLKSDRSQTPDSKKIEKSKHVEKKTQNIVYHKWSSEEDIHKSVVSKHDKRKYEDKSSRHTESSIQLNLNYKYQRSQWSSDDDFDRQRTLSDERKSRTYEDDFQFVEKETIHKPRSKTRWGDNISDNESETYENRYENFLDNDLVNLKDLERNRKFAEEIKEKRNRSLEKDDDYSRKSSKKKTKAEKKKAEEKEKERKKNKKKSKDKKAKLKGKKSKDKKPNVKINYSDLEDSYDEDFKTAKQKEQDLFIKVENTKKHAAKIKIDYSDFDLSLSESKDKYDKKIEEITPPEIANNEDLLVIPQTPKDIKMNIDLSEIIIDHQVPAVKNVDIDSTVQLQLTTVKNVESISLKTPELSPITIPDTPESPIIIVSPESPKPTQKSPVLSKPISKSPELPKIIPKPSELPITISKTSELPITISKTSELSITIPKTSDLPITIPKTSELSKPIPKTPELSKSIPKTPELPKSIPKTAETSNDVHKKQEIVTPTNTKIQELSEEKTPKVIHNTEPKIEGITPLFQIRKKSPLMLTPTSTPIKILPDFSPVAAPVLPIPKPGIDLPVTQDSSKLVSEYEEFMKAVCFDEAKDDTVIETSSEIKEKLKVHELEKQKKEVEEAKPTEEPMDESQKDEESDSSLEETSSEYESSEEERTDTSSDSESLSPDSAKMKMLETVAKIKTEKLTDSENSQESRTEKRKRNEGESSSDKETFENIVVKIEKDSKKMKQSEEIKTFECESKYDKVIDWEKSCVDNTNLYKNYEEPNINLCKTYVEPNKFSFDSSEMMPPCVLPENIPLPNDNIVETIAIQDIPTPDYTSYVLSPKEVINISSDTTTQSPSKKLRSFIPIKLLTAESRKQANETAKLTPSDQAVGFGKFTPKDLVTQDEEKVTSVGSSSDISLSNSESFSIVTANETADDQEQNSSRKRQSQWALNIITPSKKPLLQTKPFDEVDSDEDFTDKFIKQTDKKQDSKKSEESIDNDKPEVSTKEQPKSEPPTREDKKDDKKSTTNESHKTKEEDDKSRKPQEKSREKSRHSPERHKEDHKSDRQSPTPKFEKDKRTPRRLSREKTDRHDKNDRKDKSRESLDRKPDRTRERSRDHPPTKESIRDREKRRLSDRRLSDRKPAFSRGRSPRSRYSRDRELQRSRLRDRSKDRGLNKHKEPERNHERDRSRERIREMDRSRGDKDQRERDDRKNYRRDDRRYSRSQSPHRKDYRELENIPVPNLRPDDTDFSATSMDIVQSPVNSPLDGFKRSLADSTISDSELITQLNTPDESNEPPSVYNHLQQYYPHVQDIPCRQSPSSPKRISLDDRINLVLGLEKEPPKAIDTVCTRGPYTNNTPQNYDPYAYSRSEYDLYNSQAQHSEGYVGSGYSNQYQTPYYPNQLNTDNNIKVVQVGNVIQVVPTEQPPIHQPMSVVPIPKAPEVPPKVVQVGNMLQIVPMTLIETTAISSPVTVVAPPQVVAEKPVVVPKSTDQLVQERRAEKEKRRQEREQRRKEKERKRKEKEKRRQQKIKTKTENMIKRALLLETGEGELDISNIDVEPPPAETTDNNNLPLSWPPASSLAPVLLPKPPSKGILVSHGFREKDESSLDDSTETRKVVKFADGICPGEGTSPSGGEELPSPPPPPRKLPKEKRYKRIKSNKNRKKIKVKIIRTQQQTTEDESSSEDNLPPPPPPPGSPPPHLWPPRVKQAPVNNIHPSLPASVFPHGPPAFPAPQQVMYPPAYPPLASAGQPVPVVMGHAPPPSQRQHHPPVMPVLQTGPPPAPPHHGAHQSAFHH